MPLALAVPGETIETRQPRFQLVRFNDIKLGTARRDLVKGLIPRDGVAVIWGPPKTGKSFLALDLAMHVALGRDYRGRKVLKAPVVYGAFEGQNGMRARIEAFRLNELAQDHDGDVPFFLLPVRIDLINDKSDLIENIRRQLPDHPALVVLDTLNRSFSGSESNDEDMTAYIAAADLIREAFHCAVIIVHHCGHDASRPRGHSSLTAAVDVQISVQRDTADNIIMTVEKAKDGPEGDQIVSRLEAVEVGQDEDGEVVRSCVVVPVDNTQAVINRRKLTGAPAVAYRCLQEAVADAGQPAGASNHAPANVKVVSIDVWREYCDQGGLTDSSEPDSKRKAFTRSYNRLLALGHIGVWNDMVWLVRD